MENVITFSTKNNVEENYTELAMCVLKDLNERNVRTNNVNALCYFQYRAIEKIFSEEITLGSELVDKLKLFDILSIDCFDAHSASAKRFIEAIKYDLKFILIERYFQRKNGGFRVCLSFEITDNEFIMERHRELISKNNF